jgi:hypothetical protein
MVAERQIISADVLSRVLTLPAMFAHQELEVVIYPANPESARAVQEARDLELINANAEHLNAGAEENLLFQADIWADRD